MVRTKINETDWSDIDMENQKSIMIQLNYLFNPVLKIFEQQLDYKKKYKEFYH